MIPGKGEVGVPGLMHVARFGEKVSKPLRRKTRSPTEKKCVVFDSRS